MPIAEFEKREKMAAIALLGGAEALGGMPDLGLGIHDLIVEGFPPEALSALSSNLPEIMNDDVRLQGLLGLSSGRLRRLVKSEGRLDPILSDRIWRFAAMSGLVVDLYGDAEVAQRVLMSNIRHLDDRRPVDLMMTAPGARLVWEHFKRLEYGVGI